MSFRNILLAVTLALAASVTLPAAATAEDVKHVAFFGFRLLNTSPEPTRPDEEQRVRDLDTLFRQKLDASGKFTILPIPSDMRQQIDAGPEISNCNGCERDYGQRLGADLAAWGVVQKVSNLILNINLYMEDVPTGKLVFVRSVDIRGNTDESWQHGLSYMLRHYLFGEP